MIHGDALCCNVILSLCIIILHCILRSGTVYRGKADFLEHVLRVIIHASAMYLVIKPHREFLPIWRHSVTVVRPEQPVEDDEEAVDDEQQHDQQHDVQDVPVQRNEQEQDRGDWDDVDTGNVFGAFDVDDVCMAWFDDDFYIATIVEIDQNNEFYTVLFSDDQMEVREYYARWIKHLQ